METFDFCQNTLVPVTLPPEDPSAISLGGWQFTARPVVPFQKTFKVNLYGLTWYLNPTTGLYDSTTDPTNNARALELFYETHRLWDPFLWQHPHLGTLTVRFKSPIQIPEGEVNSGGLIAKPVEINFIEHNPGY